MEHLSSHSKFIFTWNVIVSDIAGASGSQQTLTIKPLNFVLNGAFGAIT